METMNWRTASMDNTIVLQLPPGACGKAHPAFCYRHDEFWMEERYPRVDLTLIRLNGVFSQVAAAAIAHYWHSEFQIWRKAHKSSAVRQKMKEKCYEQYFLWKQIAAGSQEYNNCEIVEFGMGAV